MARVNTITRMQFIRVVASAWHSIDVYAICAFVFRTSHTVLRRTQKCLTWNYTRTNRTTLSNIHSAVPATCLAEIEIFTLRGCHCLRIFVYFFSATEKAAECLETCFNGIGPVMGIFVLLKSGFHRLSEWFGLSDSISKNFQSRCYNKITLDRCA